MFYPATGAQFKRRALRYYDTSKLKHPNPWRMNQHIQEYFDQAELPTITGLASHLGITRKVLLEYATLPKYSGYVNAALTRLEAFLEANALGGKLNTPMAIMSLKNNYGWHDKQEVVQDITTGGQPLQPSSDLAAQFAAFTKAQTVVEGEIVEDKTMLQHENDDDTKR